MMSGLKYTSEQHHSTMHTTEKQEEDIPVEPPYYAGHQLQQYLLQLSESQHKPGCAGACA